MYRNLIIVAVGVMLMNCSGRLSQEIIDTRTIHFTLYSNFVKDSFDIYVSLPEKYDSSSTFHTIYYMDANLKSGKAVRQAILDFRKKGNAIPAISVGIGHFGNYRKLRRRDLITPFVRNGPDSLISNEKNFGHCEEFYHFLQKELIPHIEQLYHCNGDRSFIGHSLGGLFAFYCLFKKEHLFRNYVALSPALWINYGNIYEFEKNYYAHSKTLNANLWLCTGSRETLNKILEGGRQMREHLLKRNYPGLHFNYFEFEGETHNSEVPKALEKILPVLVSSKG